MSQHHRQPETWRAYLGQLLETPAEKQRAARELNVSPLTLTRWVSGETEPRPGSLKKLPGVFPVHEQNLTTLIREAYDPGGGFINAMPADFFRKAIPSEFTARVLSSLARTAGPIVTSSICHLVLRQAIEQLDSELLGMEITLAQCTPPLSGRPVRSLFARVGAATPPWIKGIGRRLQFLGAEALCGYVVETREPGIIQDLSQEQGILPVRPGVHKKSIAAYPLLRRGRIAGSFLVSSTQLDFFTPERADLIEQYANLVALAYYDEDFYRPKDILLEGMPPFPIQQPYIGEFRQRILEQKRQAIPLSEAEAEQRVVQEIEEALIQYVRQHQELGKSSHEDLR